MDINILIICITVLICFLFAMATIAYVADRRHKKWETSIAFAAALVAELRNEVSVDE